MSGGQLEPARVPAVDIGLGTPVVMPPSIRFLPELGGYGERDRNPYLPRRRMRQARERRQLSQFQLAVLTGLSTTSIANLECGRTRYPRLVTIERIATALGVSLEWLREE